MKKIFSLIIMSLIINVAVAQDILKKLESKYLSVETWLLAKGFYIVHNNSDEKGIADTNGNLVLPVEYSEILYQQNEGFFIVCKGSYKEGYDIVGGRWGIVDKKGRELTPLKYSRIYGFSSFPSGYQPVNIGGNSNGGIFNGGKNGLLFKDGKEIIPCQYDFISGDINEGLFSVNNGGKWEKQPNGTNKFIGGKWGCVDLNNNVVIPLEYDKAVIFNAGVAKVQKQGVVSLIKNPIKEGNSIAQSSKKKAGGPAVSRYPAPNSDVDKDIPAGKQSNENTFAFIIANENYPDAPVPYALNDGRIFKEYCNKTLGIPEKNICLYEDATFGNIITAMEKMKDLADAFDGEASVILYYAGHGFPDEKQSTAYLLPVDGNASDITTTGYSLAKLYKDLASLKLKSSVVFLDACFSGAKREDNMLASSRGVAIKVKEEAPTGNMVVFSAAQGDETAHQMEEKGHGLFTYYLLKELQQTNGDVTLGALAEYVTKQVKRQSVVINNKKQTPTVVPSESLLNSWQDKKLK
ncbi:MAG: WG repeat-containing protein [Paraprevotella sp.]|nr:WG repeat-containing protein [Paraprevotella sp.]